MQKSIDEKRKRIAKILSILRKNYPKFKEPAVTEISRTGDPFKILIATIMSARTKDETTLTASKRLFKRADTARKMINLKVSEVERLIYPVGFYKTKARNILKTCKVIAEKGEVPDTIEELVKLPGVGRKTANLVITLGYKKYGICVDTHVHKISNRLGIVKTKTPKQTEFALRSWLPKRYWIEYNDLLVAFGQNICRPISPLCSVCPIKRYCKRIGVKTHR